MPTPSREEWYEQGCLTLHQAGRQPKTVAGLEDLHHAFVAAALAFYQAGLWLPPTIVLDVWLISAIPRGEARRGLIHPATIRAPCLHAHGLPHASSYHAWLVHWGDVVKTRSAAGEAPKGWEAQLAPAISLAMALQGQMGQWAADAPTDEAALGAMLASCRLSRASAGSHLAKAVKAAYGAFDKPPIASLGPLPACMLEMNASEAARGLPAPIDPWADRTALQWILEAPPWKPGGAPAAMQARKAGRHAFRPVGSEVGVFHERRPGRLPSNPARLAPSEFLYLHLAPVEFLRRVLNNEACRTFGQQALRDRRHPRVHCVVDVADKASWHEALPGAPRGLVSMVRCTAYRLLEDVMRRSLEEEWDLTLALRWRQLAETGPAYRGARVVEARRRASDLSAGKVARPGFLASWMLREFPALLLPCETLAPRTVGTVPNGQPADLVLRFVAVARDVNVSPSTDAAFPHAMRRELWFQPERGSKIRWGWVTTPGSAQGDVRIQQMYEASREMVSEALSRQHVPSRDMEQ